MIVIEFLERKLRANAERVAQPLRNFKIDAGITLGSIVTLGVESANLGPGLLIPPLTPERALVTATVALSAAALAATGYRGIQVLNYLRTSVSLANRRDEIYLDAELKEIERRSNFPHLVE